MFERIGLNSGKKKGSVRLALSPSIREKNLPCCILGGIGKTAPSRSFRRRAEERRIRAEQSYLGGGRGVFFLVKQREERSSLARRMTEMTPESGKPAKGQRKGRGADRNV